jgi:hypothetical protein
MRHSNPWKWVLWPAAVTLVVTVLRLTGELLDWTPALFNRSVGGGDALVGIIWLAPVFGAYFGYRLTSQAPAPGTLGRVLGWDLTALAVLASFLALGFSRPTASASQFLAIGVGSWAATAVAWRGWPLLVATLLRYGLLARLPVIIVILLGILGDWKTHYDTPPPGLPEMGTFARWVAIGVIPQLTLWMAVTVVLGLLVAVPAAALARGGSPQPSET